MINPLVYEIGALTFVLGAFGIAYWQLRNNYSKRETTLLEQQKQLDQEKESLEKSTLFLRLPFNIFSFIISYLYYLLWIDPSQCTCPDPLQDSPENNFPTISCWY